VNALQKLLQNIYGDRKAELAADRINSLLEAFSHPGKIEHRAGFSEADAVLITYGDTLLQDDEHPLQTLARFMRQHLKGVFSGLHILPFYPFSSDDGFSVIDFFKVRSDLGTWRDIQALGANFRLMVDLVVNHVSTQSDWFQSYLVEEAGFENLAIAVDPNTDLSAVTRPRSHPLLTPFDKQSGERVHVWTTFSDDQIDLNYDSLDVLDNMIGALLFYISQGATIIRLDAIAYLWKEIGTNCIHLSQTHDMVRLFRSILDRVAPEVTLITETNVPHAENVSYFGNGLDEAQMVYNFSLGPLLLHALSTGNARVLSDWCRKLITPSDRTTFFNFTASHDGIGVRPLEGILDPIEIEQLIERMRKNGALISMRRQPDGSDVPYEINITYFDALKDPDLNQDPLHIQRFLASQAVAMVLPGVPAVYIHSLLGSRNWTEGVSKTGRARSINRQQLSADSISKDIEDPESERGRVFQSYRHMIRVRSRQSAFHPHADFKILLLDDRVFGLERMGTDQTVFVLTNLSADHLDINLHSETATSEFKDLLSGRRFAAGAINLGPYDNVWLVSY
jgi:sucrose phosphorylase